jgi:hypothetical protein
MSASTLDHLRELLAQCSPEEQAVIFRELRERFGIHPYEQAVGASAEMILEAVHRAPELTRRMLRGVIADAAFGAHVVDRLKGAGWRDATPEGNHAYDYRLENDDGPITVHVKLQRSGRGAPVVKDGSRYGLDGNVYVVETQRTRSGSDGDAKSTRPYRFGEFDVLAVSLQPSTGTWEQFMYTVATWLLPGKRPGEIATLQPLTQGRSEFWTDDFAEVATWYRSLQDGRRMPDRSARQRAAKLGKSATATKRRAR